MACAPFPDTGCALSAFSSPERFGLDGGPISVSATGFREEANLSKGFPRNKMSMSISAAPNVSPRKGPSSIAA